HPPKTGAENQVPRARAPTAVPTTLGHAARPMALDRLCNLFRLSPFERDVLLLCAGVELDTSVARLVASLHGATQRSHVSFSLALTLLRDAHWSALSPGAPLRRWRLVEIPPGTAITAGPLRIDERVLHYLTGVAAPDERLAGIIEPVRTAERLGPSHLAS